MKAGGPLLPKNTKTSALPLKHTMPLFYSEEQTVATERATKGHTNDTHQEDAASRCQALALDGLRSSTVV